MKEKEEKKEKPSILLIFLFSLMAFLFILSAIFPSRECIKILGKPYCGYSKEY